MGYKIQLYYIGLDTSNESILRIKNRVSKCGHNIPDELVLKRFADRFIDLNEVLSFCDIATFFNNNNGFVKVAEYKNGNIIFVHAGIDEEASESLEWGTSEEIFVEKFSAEIGQVDGFDMKIVAGHVYTSEISGNPHFNEIYYDGTSHYYIDGDVMTNGELNILLVVLTPISILELLKAEMF